MRALSVVALSSAIAACQPAEADLPPQPPSPPKHWTALDEHAALLPAIAVDSLTLTPIVATDAGLPKQDQPMLTLDEAFANKAVSIKEKEDESVNQLTLTNSSAMPLFMLAGEVILGGKQDRIIGANTIIAANTTQSVPVFCVEHGRWDNTSKVFNSGQALAHGRLRGNASYAGQSEVWAEVSAKNELRKTVNGTDTYRQVAKQQTGGALAASEKKLRDALAAIAPADRARMIGYVVTLNGKVATIDRFGSPKLFAKLETKLMRSYLTESIDIKATAANKSPSADDVKLFMADADKAAKEQAYDTEEATTVRFKGAKASKAGVMLKKPAKGEAPTKPAYENYQAK